MFSSIYNNEPNLESWRNITGIGHGSSWGAGGFNYDDRSKYPPGLSSRPHELSSTSTLDRRHADVQAIFLEPKKQPSQFAESRTEGGTAIPSYAETNGSESPRSSSTTASWDSSEAGTPATEYEWHVQQSDGNTLKGDAKDFIPSDYVPYTDYGWYGRWPEFGGGSIWGWGYHMMESQGGWHADGLYDAWMGSGNGYSQWVQAY